MVKLEIGENEANQRVDRFLRKYLAGAPLSAIYRIIRRDLKVGGKRVREDHMLQAGEELTLYLTPEQMDAYVKPAGRRKPARRQFQRIYEDDQVLIVSKPRGLLVHGDAFEKSNTLTNQVCGYLQEKGDYDPAREKTFAPAPVNRLDRNTSGLVIFGKTAAAVRALTRAIRERDGIRKFYQAIACGRITEEMTLRDHLEKDERTNRVRTVSREKGKAAETRVRPLVTGDQFTLVEVELITGRTHQIRVHLAEAGHPLLGDPKYGDCRQNEKAGGNGVSGQLLHAARLEFGEMEAPLEALSGRRVEAEPPKAFQQAKRKWINGGISVV